MAKKQRDIEQQKAAELEKKKKERMANDMQIKEEVEIKLRSFNHWTICLILRIAFPLSRFLYARKSLYPFNFY